MYNMLKRPVPFSEGAKSEQKKTIINAAGDGIVISTGHRDAGARHHSKVAQSKTGDLGILVLFVLHLIWESNNRDMRGAPFLHINKTLIVDDLFWGLASKPARVIGVYFKEFRVCHNTHILATDVGGRSIQCEREKRDFCRCLRRQELWGRKMKRFEGRHVLFFLQMVKGEERISWLTWSKVYRRPVYTFMHYETSTLFSVEKTPRWIKIDHFSNLFSYWNIITRLPFIYQFFFCLCKCSKLETRMRL